MLDPTKRSDYYDGSRAFVWIAELCGLSVDVMNFLICQISALFLASLFRSVLHPSKVSPAVRHTFALVIGLIFGYMCFGKHAIHIAGLPAACYIVIRTQSPAVVQRNVLLVAMAYLLCIHLIRQLYDYGSYSLDVTGPLMIITQKVTSLAFSIHDGFIGKSKDLTKAQQYHAVYKVPTALEYFSFVFNFQGLLAGPLVFYKDYIEFIEGYNLLKCQATKSNLDNGNSKLQLVEPSPTKAVIEKVIGSIVCASIFMKFDKMYPIKNMKDDDFLENTSFGYKFWYAMLTTTSIRFKFYHAWLLADAICNNSGLGFTGYSKEGYPEWDLISNIHVLQFEFASNMRQAINSWNCCTNRWLRSIVYERVPKKYGTVLTFALSAVWHGFYPGYYLTFATGALVVTSARVARRMFRHRFQQTRFTRMFYDILTVVTTRFFMAYCTFPFIMLEFMGSLRLYLKLYLCLHMVSLIVIFILPKFINGERSSRAKTTPSSDTIQIANNDTINSSNCSDNSKSRCSIMSSNLNRNNNDDIDANNRNDNDDDDDDDDDIDNNTCAAKAKNILPQNTNKNKTKNNNNNNSNSNHNHNHNHKTNNIDDDLRKNLIANVANERCKKITGGGGGGVGGLNGGTDITLELMYARDVVSVKHDQCEMDQLSSKIKEKIDAETKNIEEFIDKTVTETVCGIVEFKKDLMRRRGGERDFKNALISYESNVGMIGLRKRNIHGNANNENANAEDGSGAFLMKEIEAINAVVQQANVLPAVLSNGHAK